MMYETRETLKPTAVDWSAEAVNFRLAVGSGWVGLDPLIPVPGWVVGRGGFQVSNPHPHPHDPRVTQVERAHCIISNNSMNYEVLVIYHVL